MSLSKNEIIFDNAFKEKGGIYTENRTSEDIYIQTQITHIQNMLNVKIAEQDLQISNIHAFCINNYNINACVKKINDEYYMGIYRGTIVALKRYIESFVDNKRLQDTPFSQIEPSALKKILIINCTKFLVFHEFSHVCFGHCDLVRNLAADDLEEMNSDKLCIDPLFRQTLEYDADTSSMRIMLHELLFSSLIQNKMPVESIAQIVGLCLLSCTFIFEIFNKLTQMNNDIDKLPHPLPGIRLSYIYFSVALIPSGVYTTEEIDYICDYAINAVAKTHVVYKPDFSASFISDGSTQNGIARMQRIHDNWKSVREMLLPFTYTKLKPFINIDINSYYSEHNLE